MADTDYKIVGSKMYIYPNTETEQALMNGLITPVEGYTTYITVQNYYKTVKAQTSYENRLAQYDYYLQCVRVPEWAPDSPTPPQPTYKAIIVNDSYGLEYVLQYTNGTDVNPSAVEVGRNVVFSTNNPAYTQTFSEGLEVEEYGALPSGAIGYKFRMPDYDVEITITEAQPSVTLTVVNQDSRNINWYDGTNWYNNTQTVRAGANIDFICWSTSDKITFSSPIEYTEEFDSEGRYQYHFTLNEDLTVTTGARTEAGIYYDGNTDITIQVGETPTYPTLENPNNVSPITYSSSNTDLATVDSSGNVTLVPNATGEAYITATFEGDSTYDFSGTHFHIKVIDGYNVGFIKTGAVEAENVRIYNLTKGKDATIYDPTAPNDTIFVIGAAQDDKVMYKDSSNTWTTLTSSYTTETIGEQSENGIEFTIPSGIGNYDYILIMTNTDDLYDVTGDVNGNLYNETGLNAWWYYIEDQEHPGTYSTKYPNGTNLGIESREGQTYTINPTQTQEQGGAVGMYIVMPSEAIEITKTN